MLKLNDDKTEIIHLSSRFRSSMLLEFVNVGQSNIGPVAQPWRRLSRPKSRSRRSRNGDRWAAIACIAQLGSATAVAGRR